MSAWEYSDVRSSSHGSMKCTLCGQGIVAGEYRYRQKSARGDWYYQTQHRACCESDPHWERMEEARREHKARWAEFVADCIAFREKWREFDVTELNDYITEDNPND